jgi:phosphoribosylanthranilate isomerase
MTIIKICGIKTLKDALAAIDAGADYLGFNFYPKGVRFIKAETCAEITFILKKEHPNIRLVGVFVNYSVNEVKNILEICSLDLAQLHGDETPEIFAQLAPRAFRAFRGIPSVRRKRRHSRLVSGGGVGEEISAAIGRWADSRECRSGYRAGQTLGRGRCLWC